MNIVDFSFLFQDFKLYLVEGADLARDALHIHIGLAIFVLARLLWRWRGGWFFAWTLALAVTLGGEWLDSLNEDPANAAITEPEHWRDIWNTMLWPTILLFIGRWLQPKAKTPEAAADENSGDLSDESLEHPPTI